MKKIAIIGAGISGLYIANLFKDHKFEEAQKIYEALVGMDPGSPKVIGGLLRCLVQLKKYDDAKEMMESLDDETLKKEEISKINKYSRYV